MKKILAIGLMFLVLAPFGVMAEVGIDPNLTEGAGNLTLLISFLGAGLNVATRLILGATIVFFLWGVFQFVKSAGDEEARAIGKNHIIYGVIGIAVMVSMWGLVNFLTSSVRLNPAKQQVPLLPEMPASTP